MNGVLCCYLYGWLHLKALPSAAGQSSRFEYLVPNPASVPARGHPTDRNVMPPHPLNAAKVALKRP